MTGGTHDVERLLRAVADKGPSDEWDLLRGWSLAGGIDHQLLGEFTLRLGHDGRQVVERRLDVFGKESVK